MASSRIQESFLLGEISKKFPVTFQVICWMCCFGGNFQTETAGDQLSELFFQARQTKLSRLTTFFASTATTLFSHWAESGPSLFTPS